MNQRLRSKLDTYKMHRSLITDVLRALSDEQLGLTIGKNLGTLGKLFKHVGRIQNGYIEAIRTGKLTFFKRIGDPSLEKSREKLLSLLDKNDREMFSLLEGMSYQEMDSLRIDGTGKTHQSGNSLSIYALVNDLTYHEILHQGELVVYLIALGLPFPDSWKLWGSAFLRRNR